jgi:hypothetical protein
MSTAAQTDDIAAWQIATREPAKFSVEGFEESLGVINLSREVGPVLCCSRPH